MAYMFEIFRMFLNNTYVEGPKRRKWLKFGHNVEMFIIIINYLCFRILVPTRILKFTFVINEKYCSISFSKCCNFYCKLSVSTLVTENFYEHITCSVAFHIIYSMFLLFCSNLNFQRGNSLRLNVNSSNSTINRRT